MTFFEKQRRHPFELASASLDKDTLRFNQKKHRIISVSHQYES